LTICEGRRVCGGFELRLSQIVELGNEQVHSILKFTFISYA
jgi:hypothetical protein